MAEREDDFANMLIKQIIQTSELLKHHDLQSPGVREHLLRLAGHEDVRRVMHTAKYLYADQK